MIVSVSAVARSDRFLGIPVPRVNTSQILAVLKALGFQRYLEFASDGCFVEVRRRTRPMVVFTNVETVDRIIYAIFSQSNEDWKNHTLQLFTQAA